MPQRRPPTRRPPTRRTALLVAAVVVVVAAIVAVPAVLRRDGNHASPPATSATPSAPASPSGSAPTSASPQPGTCTTADLSVSLGRSGAATGHVAVPIVFTNVGDHTCTLLGYPMVVATGADGTALGSATPTLTGFIGGTYPPPALVTLTAGARAAALVEYVDIDGAGACAGSTGLAITPPGSTDATSLAASVALCDLQVHPIVPSDDGRPT